MQWDDWALSSPLAVTDVDPDLAFFTLVVFLLTLVVLWKFAWKPIVEGLDKREKSIADQIEQAKSDAEKAQQTLKDYEAKLAAAADEARALLTEARQEGEFAKERILTEAKEASEREKQRAIADIQAAKDQAVRELAERSVDTAISLAGQLVHKELDAKAHASLIEESLEKFSAN